MELEELIKKAKDLPEYEWEREFNEFIRQHGKYQNLDEANRKIVFDLVKKFKPYLRQGIGISEQTIQNESYRLYQNRIKLNLTDEDLKDIKEILREFKK